MGTRKRRRFTAEYESEAVKRLAESGKTLQAVAQELGVHANQLRGWRNEHLAAGTAEALARQKAEAAELARLRRGGERVGAGERDLKKGPGFFRPGRGGRAGPASAGGEAARAGERDPQEGRGFFRQGGGRLMRYRFVAAERATFPVRTLCRIVGVAVSGFYAWLRRGPGRRRRDDRRVSERMAAIFEASRRTYGSPRVHAELRAEGVRVGRKRVARLMREGGLAVARRRRRVPRTTDSRHDLPVAPNLLDRRFAAERPDAVWLADIPYIPTGEGWLYLAAIKDVATREIVGWSMADHLGAELACDALRMALQRRQPPPGLIHHSDRGVQGGFKRSSQHLDGRVRDGHAEAAFGSGVAH